MDSTVDRFLSLKLPRETQVAILIGDIVNDLHVLMPLSAMGDKDDSVRESVVEKDTEALLLRDVLLNGILAIGTLGHDVDLCPEAFIKEDVHLIMGEQRMEEEKYEEERDFKVQEEVLVTALTKPAPVVESAKLHSSSMKGDSFVCYVEEEILMHEAEEGIINIQEQPLLMVEKVEKIRTTLADLFAAEVFSSTAPVEKICHNVTIVPGASTSKPMSCMEKMNQKKPTKPTPKSLKATRKLSRVWLLSPISFLAIMLIL
ncbi:hypothetical protein PR202_gb23092 [Eleusine coracana subsp. coracana]|uniref:Protein TILLER ANGLE CONTROL 1 n=1 Tax=Eleusine coracana subsp. coracana TaxID=191504 RepID=A0AAV5FFF2_ELECO|nr:hypothetical protein PR202_gb23092 [Eleusine coracana subsp. coracana]